MFTNFKELDYMSIGLKDWEIYVEFKMKGKQCPYPEIIRLHYTDFLIMLHIIENKFYMFKPKTTWRHYNINNHISWPKAKYISRTESIHRPISIEHCSGIVLRLASTFCNIYNRWELQARDNHKLLFLCESDIAYIISCKNVISSQMNRLMLLRPLIVLVQLAICLTIKQEDKYKNMNPMQLDLYLNENEKGYNFKEKIKKCAENLFHKTNEFPRLMDLIKLQRVENESYRFEDILHYAFRRRNELITLFYTDILYENYRHCKCWKPTCLGSRKYCTYNDHCKYHLN